MVDTKSYICFSPSIIVPWVRDDGAVKSTVDTKFLEVKLWLTRAPL